MAHALAETEAQTVQPWLEPAPYPGCSRARGGSDRRLYEVVALTPAEAQRLQEAARARGRWLIWFVSVEHPDHPGKAVAWGVAADPSGGARLPGMLEADTLDELRAMLPAGLTRTDRSAVMGPEVLEVWD